MKFTLPSGSYQQFEEDRRHGLQQSDQLRIESKSAIGFLLKDDPKKAEQSLKKAADLLKVLKDLLAANPYLYSIGGLDVGMEEYVEARLLADYLEGKALSSIEDLGVNHEVFYGGLCDMSGELIRLARKFPEKIDKLLADLETLQQGCLELVVTRNGRIRKKLEDLERNVRKLEEMKFQYQLRPR